MLYKRNREHPLSEELFGHPTAEYRGTPFWSWNCKVTKELIREQMECFRRMGFGGAHLHPRTGLDVPYLSEEYLQLVRYAVEQAREQGMLCWLYDEDRFPSGSAGGIVTENLHYRVRHLLLTRERKEGMCASREDFCAAVDRGEKPAGYYLTAYRVKLQDGRLAAYGRVAGGEPDTDSPQKEREQGKLWLAYVELGREEPWYNNQTYVDVMNPKAVRRFLEVTHERYAAAVGDEFGKTIPAIFTDEPQIRGSMAFADAESREDITLSFTDDLPESFQRAYQTDLLSVVPELLWELPGKEVSVHRYRYHEHLTERFVSAYSDTISAWCTEHGIAMTGHYMSEPTLYSQTLRLGEAMRCYRRQHLPGIDILCGDPEYSTVKQAASVAHQYGREGVLSELYGVNHWDFDFKGHKLQGDWQAALGVTIRVPHLAFMSMEGEAKRDWPASIQYQSPWWEEYRYVEDYFARVNTAMTRGVSAARIAVIHPIESYWTAYGPVSQTGAERRQMEDNFRNVIEWLLFGLLDFDFVSESLLPELCGEGMAQEKIVQEGTVTEAAAREGAEQEKTEQEEGLPEGIAEGEQRHAWRVGKMSYDAVIVPGLKTIRSTTLEQLERLAAAGGKVVFMGQIPSLVDGEKSRRPMELARICLQIPYQRRELLETLEEERDVDVCGEDGRQTDNLFYQLRKDREDRWLFVCHVNRKRNLLDRPERLLVRIRGSYDVTAYDAMTGTTAPVESRVQDGWTQVRLEMFAEDSLLWRLKEVMPVSALRQQEGQGQRDSREDSPKTRIPTGTAGGFYGLVAGQRPGWEKEAGILEVIRQPEYFRTREPNVLLLDQAAWQLDDEPWQEKSEILRIDTAVRRHLGFSPREDAGMQPWRIPDTPATHRVRLRYELESEIETGPLQLALERPEETRVSLNGALCDVKPQGWYVDRFIRTIPVPGLHRGTNELRLELLYGPKSNLENVYLLGDFGVAVRGTRAAVTEPVRQLWFGDITGQGFPFYGGSLCYGMSFHLERTQRVRLRVPHFKGPVLKVMLDGKEQGLIAYAPHVLALGELPAGTHRLELLLYGNRFNTFGTLHNCNDEYKWYGPASYRTQGSEWSENWCLRPFGIFSRVEILEE